MPKPAKYSSQANQPEKFCRYIHRFCNQTRLDGYNYCIRHILEDKSAPFRQCTYVHSVNKKRCTNAAPKTDKSEKRDGSLCPWHAKRALQKTKFLCSKKKTREGTASSLLRDLEHYCSNSKHDPKYSRDVGLNEKYDNSSPITSDAMEGSLGFFDRYSKGDAASPFKDPIQNLKFDGCLTEKPGPADPLAHCGAYTSKEVLRLTLLKAKTLQALYNDRLNHTFEAIRDARLEYLAERKAMEAQNLEDRYETCVDEKILDKDEVKAFKALEKYHTPQGTERLLCHLADMKYQRIKKKHVHENICIFVENGKKCNRKRISLSKYCFNHILHDPNQVLFKPCGLGKSNDCNNPVLPIEDDVSCEQHLHLTLLKPNEKEVAQNIPPAAADPVQEQEHFQSMDDIASLGLDVVTPGSLFGLDQFLKNAAPDCSFF
ncbi:KAT8 regulatory NSL complex subunit 2-like isoform X2 [Stegodyphus dumicola]|uniref:KAT8 regulatory NSL complex subunit 2-like isoform X2 n=1 Tax=Stegodyphus dumicola TaxID=202533 RepID=UPI0015AA7507|nr:KAT8 regulatory NSL complex subunit 2-like isoform X2 [Stegodyphus dumicola]